MATWTMATVNASYPNVLSMAQNRSTGQYLLAIVTAAAQGGADVVCRAYKSSNYGATWDLLENLFTTSYADGRDLNYTTLQSLNRSTLYGCAISDDGKYQVVTQKTYGDPRFIWYSTDYGVMTPKNDGADDGQTANKNPNAGWKWTTSGNLWPNDAGYLVKYTQGLYPALTGSNGTTIWMDQRFTRPPGTAGIVAGKIITTRDVANSQGNEFTFDVPDMFPNGYGSTPVYCVFLITNGNLVRKNAGSALEVGSNVTATIINPSGWPVSATEGGGVVVLSNSTTVYAARFVSGTGGGIWKSTDSGTNWTQLRSGINVNAIGVSSNEQYIIAGPRTPTSGSGTFYISRDSAATWTTQVVSFSGYINYLYITNNGKYAIGGANRTEASSWAQYSSVGYFSYVGPLTAAEQRAAGKTVAELFALSFSQSEIISAGYSASELLAAGIVPDWNYDATANRLKQSYVNDFIDLSGTLLLRNNANLYVHGNTNVNGNLLMNDTIMQRDLSFNKRIFVGGDTSMNGNVTIANDVSLNGSVLGCTFNSNSIPTSAFVSTVTAPGPDYTKATIIYQKFQANGDVSMNGSTVQATNMTVNGNIVFNDGTKMNTYDDNKTVGIELPYSNAYTCTNIASTYHGNVGRGLVSSDDGKYLLSIYGVNDGTSTYASGNAGIAGLFLSSDYGQSFTLVTLPTVAAYTHSTNSAFNIAANDLTNVSYVAADMSPSGQHMLCTLTGTGTRANWKNSVIAYSSNYGSTWSTKFTWDFIKIPAYLGQYDVIATAVAISNDASIVIINIGTTASQIAATTPGTYISRNSMVSFTRFAPISIFQNKIFLLANNTRILVSTAPDSKAVAMYDLSGNNMSFPTTIPAQMLFNAARNGNIIIETHGWSGSTKTCNITTTSDFTTFTRTDVLTNNNTILPDIWTTQYTTLRYVDGISSLISPSGKYIILGDHDYGSPSSRPNIFTKVMYYSNNYGKDSNGNYQFTKMNPIYPLAGDYRSHSAVMTDSGFLFVKYSSAYGNNILRLDFRKFKASTFTGLTIKNTLTAGSYVVSSDYRIKNNVAKLDKTFTVNNLRPVKYLQTLINKKQYGLIAHELQQYYPDLVFGEKDGQDLQRVNYTGLIAILINEIIQLKQEFRELEKKRKVAI
jgi:hypothetical protein